MLEVGGRERCSRWRQQTDGGYNTIPTMPCCQQLYHGSHPGASSMKCHQLVSCLNTGYVCSLLPPTVKTHVFSPANKCQMWWTRAFCKKVYTAIWAQPFLSSFPCMEIAQNLFPRKKQHQSYKKRNISLTISLLNFYPLVLLAPNRLLHTPAQIFSSIPIQSYPIHRKPSVWYLS